MGGESVEEVLFAGRGGEEGGREGAFKGDEDDVLIRWGRNGRSGVHSPGIRRGCARGLVGLSMALGSDQVPSLPCWGRRRSASRR